MARGRKGQGALYAAFSFEETEGVGRPVAEGILFRTGEACPHWENWSGRSDQLPQGLKMLKVPVGVSGVFIAKCFNGFLDIFLYELPILSAKTNGVEIIIGPFEIGKIFKYQIPIMAIRVSPLVQFQHFTNPIIGE